MRVCFLFFIWKLVLALTEAVLNVVGINQRKPGGLLAWYMQVILCA